MSDASRPADAPAAGDEPTLFDLPPQPPARSPAPPAPAAAAELAAAPAAPADPLLAVLRRHWGYDSFRALQREAIGAVLAGRDSLVVLPTGGGKSLCFQAPALMVEGRGPALVVSPLISLMKDQVDALTANGVAAACLNSAQTAEERRRVRLDLAAGKVRLLYVSPERLVGDGSDGFRERVAGLDVPFVAVDEAHCISQWGHDFRPSYRALGALREVLPRVSVHAFTATATERVRRDIVGELGLRDAAVLVGSFDRPNLVYRVERKGERDRQVRAVLDRHRGEAGIVYCISRREVEEVAATIASWGVAVRPYHAGLADEVRARHQEEFSSERVDVVVATVAFGMGIDRSDVRFVVHVGSPRSLEHYQQEAGRAGRDGLPAECVLLHSSQDYFAWRRLLERDGPISEADLALLREMQGYAGTPRCRHRALVEYFGEPWGRGPCGACDWCLGELDHLDRVDDALVVGQKVLSAVLRTDQRFGAGHVADVLRGRETDKVRARGHHQVRTFGALADESERAVRSVIDQLLDQGFLEQVGDRYPVLQVTAAGRELLRGELQPVLYRERVRAKKRAAPSKAERESWEGVDRDLFEALRELRREIARERGVPPYVVGHDSMLRELARVRPTTLGGLLAVRGMGEKKAAELGERFLAVIAGEGAGGTAGGGDGGGTGAGADAAAGGGDGRAAGTGARDAAGGGAGEAFAEADEMAGDGAADAGDDGWDEWAAGVERG
ncbi:MAG TPA: DNA helicase RecQ [Thermoanaerobaculia bacterium]